MNRFSTAPMTITQEFYLIIDLEATCADDQSIAQRQMEMIEIGAVMLNRHTLNVVSEYQTFVRPILHPQLTAFCTALTSISQADVDRAPLFPEALKSLQTWLHPFGGYLFCSWGGYDKAQFEQDCRLHNLSYPFAGEHLNLKQAFAVSMNSPKKFGMVGALARLGIDLEGIHHRGIDDARNIARIVQTVLSQ